MPQVARTPPPDTPVLLRALADEAGGPLRRTLVVAPAIGAGRELLRALARTCGGWSGLEVTTVRPLAVRCAAEWIAAEGVRALDGFEEEARFDEALDRALEEPRHRDFVELGEGVGFRRGARSTLLALRLTAVGPEALERADFESPLRRSLLATALRFHEEALLARREADIAGVLERATRALQRGAHLPADRILLLPGLGLRGRSGRFVRALHARGAVVLPTDPVLGMDPPPGMLWRAGEVRSGLSRLHEGTGNTDDHLPLFVPPHTPTVELFHAAGVHEELREVLRRVVDGGHRWDEVEIATPDPGGYGPVLQTLCARLGIDTTFAVGLPVARTRPGRAVAAWFRWVAEDFPSAPLRRLLEAGDLVAPRRRPADSPHLARTLRSLRIGWGRERYASLIGAALERARTANPATTRHTSAEEAARRRDLRIRDLESLNRLMGRILATAPDPSRPASAADVARGLGDFLALVEVESEVDRSALERLRATLERIRATLRRPTRFTTAVAIVREHLDFRVPAPRAEGRAPWLSDGGALHLTDLEHAGLSGRPLLFIVGMDSGRFPAGDRQDPFLLDRERAAIDPELPRGEEQIHETEFRFASLLARARGTITVSYPAWLASEGRTLQPAAVVLQLFRFARGERTLGYGDLLAHLGTPVSRIPQGQTALDADDVWLDALDAGGHFRDGARALRDRHDALDRGLGAAEAPTQPEGSPHVGVVGTEGLAPGRLDPRAEGGPSLSASRLEALGSCPLRYFYANVLRVRPPDDPEFDLERWLGPAERGVLLHDVFQAAVDLARTDALSFSSSAFREQTFAALDRRVEQMRVELPPPGEAVFVGEVQQLRSDVRSFCAYLAASGLTPSDVVATEYGLGDEEPVHLSLPGGGNVRLRGRIDRIDRLPDGLRVVDYKTGSAWGHDPADGVYRGGRRLQHVLYARALESAPPDGVQERGSAPGGDGRPRVRTVEYHYPTVRGENQTFDYPAAHLEGGMELVEKLLRLPASGRFPATDSPDDCTFCDYRVVCRHAPGESRSEATTPRVEWTRARIEANDPLVAELRDVRESGS